MPLNPPEGSQRIIPYLLYEEAVSALEFLQTAFGFEERFRLPGEDGKIGHAELAIEDNIIMVATRPTAEQVGHEMPDGLGRNSMIVCYVNDVDAHHEHAKSAGANVLTEPTDQFYGDRTYKAIDPEGNYWYFHQHVKDVSLQELTQTMGRS